MPKHDTLITQSRLQTICLQSKMSFSKIPSHRNNDTINLRLFTIDKTYFSQAKGVP